MITDIRLVYVHYVPPQLEPGILYVSKEFEVAAHLCPCHCNNKIVTPLGKTEWLFQERKGKATLYPSLGNWQLPCRSHYWITGGKIVWSYQFTEKEIQEVYAGEKAQREAYYSQKASKKKLKSAIKPVSDWVRKLFLP